VHDGRVRNVSLAFEEENRGDHMSTAQTDPPLSTIRNATTATIEHAAHVGTYGRVAERYWSRSKVAIGCRGAASVNAQLISPET
jgi:hypothetical protein